MNQATHTRASESGNVIFFILLGIALIGLVTVALRSGGTESANIDGEQMVIKISQVQQYADQLERGVNLVYQNTRSESEISFAYTTAPSDYGTFNSSPANEIFNVQGGGAEYSPAPSGINDGSSWEFYATSAAPDVGSDAADLIAVLPNVTDEFCTAINKSLGQTGAMADTGTCLYDSSGTRFTGTYATSPNTFDTSGFVIRPAPQGCVRCSAGSTNHYYRVILPR